MYYGVDVGARRFDDIDKAVIGAVGASATVGRVLRVLDAGCGSGRLAATLRAAGAVVTALDIAPPAVTVGDVVQADVTTWITETTDTYDVAVLQRVLHYMPYTVAKATLHQLSTKVTSLYLSVTGATTAIAEHYDYLPIPLTSRYGLLTPEGQQLFSITAPLCLYREEELLALLAETGWRCEWSRVSAFGNVKVRARSTLH